VATAAIIAVEISTHAVQAAPLGLPAKIAAVVLKGSAAAGSTLTLVKGTLQIMTWLKVKTVTIYGSVALLAAGASLAVDHCIRYVANENQAKAAQEKLEAERQGGFANFAQGPDAQKLEAEQKEKDKRALRLQQEREQREKDQRGLRLQQGQQ
jgi:hypothetical protein